MIRNLVLRTSAIGGISAVVSLVIPCTAPAQEVSIPVEADSATVDSAQFINSMAGEFTPAKGFDSSQSERGSLNISFYGMARYLNQLPGEQTFTDHLGRERKVVARNDINWHRGMVWFNGHFWNGQAPLQHHGVGPGEHPADPPVRESPVPARPPVELRNRDGAEPHDPLAAGLVSVLGRE